MVAFRSVAVIGAGVMGTGIARHLAQTENKVFLLDVDSQQLSRAEIATADSIITCTPDFDVLADADYVIEAVVEDIGVKKNLLARLSTLCSSECILATNTSSLLVSELASAVTSPERFLGVHYNNPADLNPIVEIIPSSQTRPEIADQIQAWMISTGKTAIRCTDTSGFILNRQSLPYINEAVRCLDVATPGQVDLVASQELGVGLGPFAVMNLVGLRVMAAASRNLSILGAGYLAADRLQQMAAADEPVWTIEPEDVTDLQRENIRERLLGAMMFPGRDILDQSLCSKDDLHTICIEALGYQRSSPELLDQLDDALVRKLLSDYLARQSSA